MKYTIAIYVPNQLGYYGNNIYHIDIYNFLLKGGFKEKNADRRAMNMIWDETGYFLTRFPIFEYKQVIATSKLEKHLIAMSGSRQKYCQYLSCSSSRVRPKILQMLIKTAY